ncbi:putative oxidoreductase [Micromonospora viridifaciens]|uniref:Putative oxidoreductase n=1 Tax=Micromonospora viridifaciens TaxID=1881 RepID=A0A1C4XAV6_MICVI|nr:DoxX family protein [Micromonospora viridifaciens]SCF05341.1 putative oxidoreductase [Micromonospora viridifaciens]
MNNVRDLAVLVARVALGVVFIAHGWQKLTEWGLDGTAAAFDQMGVPLPTASAWFAALVELVGGAALVVGLVVPVAGLLLALDMLGAFLVVHLGNGVFVSANGFELVLALGAAALLLAAVGAGRFSLDRLIAPRLSRGAGGRAPEPAAA